jgi:hypothetical protein
VHWGLVVAGLYVLMFIAFTLPFLLLAWPVELSDAAGIYLMWPYWVWLGVMFVCQVVLLLVPVGALDRRSAARRALVLPVLVSGLMAGLLALGALFTLMELCRLSRCSWGEWLSSFAMFLVIPILVWAVWAVVFYGLGRRQPAINAAAEQSSRLLAGSILELLVAIPTHIVARNRHECCAGIYSFVGLTLGMSVMLFAYGPAVFFLFVARWQRLRGRQAH